MKLYEADWYESAVLTYYVSVAGRDGEMGVPWDGLGRQWATQDCVGKKMSVALCARAKRKLRGRA